MRVAFKKMHNSIACYMQLHKVKRLKGSALLLLWLCSALPSHDLHLHFAFSNYKYTWGFSHCFPSRCCCFLWHPAKDHKDCHLKNLCHVAKAPRALLRRPGKTGSMHSQCMSNASGKQIPNKTETKPKHST